MKDDSINQEESFFFQQGDSPLLVSMPHVGSELCASMKGRVTAIAESSVDTDWHVDRLYDFLGEMDISVLRAKYSRYVVDLNRPTSGKSLYKNADETELCPLTSFLGEELYLNTCQPDEKEITSRIEHYWQPYHSQLRKELERIKAKYGYALLLDAHSIKSIVPRFFEGSLPDFNFGTRDGMTAPDALLQELVMITKNSLFSTAENARFKGGYITKHYGNPDQNIIALQLELAQINYMDEEVFQYLPVKAVLLQKSLRQIVQAFVHFYLK